MNTEDVLLSFVICMATISVYRTRIRFVVCVIAICSVIKEMKLLYPNGNGVVGGDFNMTPGEWKDRYSPN